MIKVKQFLNDFQIYTSENPINNPEISVIMPTFCRGDNGLLERAIQSVLNQTYRNFEFIIVDDGSVDGTRQVVMRYLKDDHRIVYIRNDINSGLPALRVNQGIGHARGTYIAYQFDDDQWTEIALEALHNEMIRHKEDCLVYGKGLFTNLRSHEQFYIGSKMSRYSDLLLYNRIINNSVLHPKSLCYEYGAYDCHLVMRRTSDWDLWLRWAEKVPFVYVDEVVSKAEAFHEKSLGSDFIFDLQLFRIYYSQDRTELLKLNDIEDYIVDNLDFLHDEAYREETYRTQILPWLADKKEMTNSNVQYFTDKRTKYVLAIKYSYDATVIIMIKNLIRALDGAYRFLFIPEIQLNADSLKNIDIVVFCRTFHQPSTAFLSLCKKAGIPTLYAIDDNLLNIYKLGDEYRELIPGMPTYNNLTYQLSNVDLVLSYSRSISDSVRPINPKIIEMDTNIPAKYLKKTQKNSDGKIFKIAFLGTKAREAELDFIWDDLLEISNQYKESVEFHFWGYIPGQIGSIQKSRVFTSEFSVNYEEYLNRLSKSQFDLLLSPLFENDFKKGKCPIKFLEAAVCGAIGLYSEVAPYEAVVDGVTGFKIDNEKGLWARKINQIINMKVSERNNIRDNAALFINKNFTSEVLAEKFERAVESVMALDRSGKPDENCGLVLSKPIRNRISYRVLLKKDPVSRIGIKFRSCSKKCGGNLRLTFKDPDNRILESFDIDLAYLPVDCTCYFQIRPIANCRNKTFTIDFVFQYKGKTRPVSVYEHQVNRGLLYRFRKRIKNTDVLYVEMD